MKDPKLIDADDYYWLPSNPPFQDKREPALRLSLLLADLDNASSRVLSGSVVHWGPEIEESFSGITIEAVRFLKFIIQTCNASFT